MGKKISRRDFLKQSFMGAGAIAATDYTYVFKKFPPGKAGKENVELIPSVCEMCFWKCGIIGKVKDGRLLKIEGNPLNPHNGEKICGRGNAGIMQLYDPDRLKYPLLNLGERGKPKWKRISWEEAFDRISKKMLELKEKHGAKSVANLSHGSSSIPMRKLLKNFGTDRISHASFDQCRGNRDVAYELTFGVGAGSPERADFINSKVIYLTGTHFGENAHTSIVREFIEAVEGKKAKLIVADPRYSVAASKADYWLPIKPGTDTALILTLINYIIQNNLYDKEFVAKYTYGFSELKKEVSKYTPEWAEQITEIKKEMIVEIAELMGKNRPAVNIFPGRQSTWYGNDTQRVRALAILSSILGTVGRKGGYFFPTKIRLKGCPCPNKVKKEDFLCDTSGYPFTETTTECIRDATLKGDIKMWIVYGSNVIHNTPRPQKTIDAINKLEYMVVVDIKPTEPSLYADIVLPEATYLERYDIPFAIQDSRTPFIQIRRPVVQPLYEAKDAFYIVSELSKKLGLKECFPCNSMEDYLNLALSSVNTNLNKVEKQGGIVRLEGKPYLEDYNGEYKFNTPTGKIELFSTKLKKADRDPIPKYEPVEDTPRGWARLSYGRSPVHTFSRTENNKWLHTLLPENDLWINSEAAQKMGLKDGEYVKLKNQDGVISDPVKLKITPGIRPDMVHTYHGFGTKSPFLKLANNKGMSDNELMTKIVLDPIMGGMAKRINFVKIIKDGKEIDFPYIKQKPSGFKKKPEKEISIKLTAPLPVGAQEEEDEGGC